MSSSLRVQYTEFVAWSMRKIVFLRIFFQYIIVLLFVYTLLLLLLAAVISFLLLFCVFFEFSNFLVSTKSSMLANHMLGLVHRYYNHYYYCYYNYHHNFCLLGVFHTRSNWYFSVDSESLHLFSGLQDSS